MYAIARMIQHELAKRDWRKSHLVVAMGYKNVARGMKRLDSCLQYGDCANAELLSRLCRILELPREQFDATIAETRRQRMDEERAKVVWEEAQRRARFQPYIYVRTAESAPRFIRAAAVIGPRLKNLPLCAAELALPRPLLLSCVAEKVREHYRINLGKCLLFGEITGYALRVSYDETVEFTPAGVQSGWRADWTEDERYALPIFHEHIISDGLFGIAY